MTVYDSSALIDYLDDVETAVEYVEANLDDRTVAPPLVMFEIYQGEVFRSGKPDFEAVDEALEWLSVIDERPEFARAAAELQNELQCRGEPLAARDAFIAGTAKGLGERLVVADSDFAVDGIAEALEIDFL